MGLYGKAQTFIFCYKKRHGNTNIQGRWQGGQHQNKTNSGVRIIHNESGAIGISRNDRSQYRNKKLAFQRLVKTSKFQFWVSKRINEIRIGKTIEEQVDKEMKSENLKVEIKDKTGKWVEYQKSL